MVLVVEGKHVNHNAITQITFMKTCPPLHNTMAYSGANGCRAPNEKGASASDYDR